MLFRSRKVRYPPQVIQHNDFQVGLRDVVGCAGFLAAFAIDGAAEVVLLRLHFARAAQHHVPTAVGAVDQSGKQPRFIHVLGRTPLVLTDTLHGVPQLLVDKGLVGVLHQYLLLRRTVNTKATAVCDIIKALGVQYASEYATAEPNMAVDATCMKTGAISALTAGSTEKVYSVLVALPDSVQAMSVDMPGLVQTSTNFGVMKLEENELTFSNTIRSSITAQKWWIVEKITGIVKLAGGVTVTDGNYPGWAYNPHSVVKDTILAAYKKLFNVDATVEAVHAGIECGLFADSIPHLDCVSIGPTMADVHTPREHLSISSSERTFRLLKEVLAQSK